MRAIAAFNPAAGEPGFLQPLLVPSGGDNRSFIQICASPDRVDDFGEVSWPDEHVLHLPAQVEVTRGGAALWGFSLPDEPPIVDFWQAFRERMAALLAHPALEHRPLLQFDIVETLGFVGKKREVFTRAYQTYLAMDAQAAGNWRDRAILEPALEHLLRAPGLMRAGDRLGESPSSYRARLIDGNIHIFDDGAIDAGLQLELQKRYERLAAELPEIFPQRALVLSVQRPSRTFAQKPKEPSIQLVLAESLRGALRTDDRWLAPGVQAISADDYHPGLEKDRRPDLDIIIGSHRDNPQMIDLSQRSNRDKAIVFALSTSAVPVTSDLDFQSAVDLPTVTYFAPFATSPDLGRNPIKTVQPLVAMLRKAMQGQVDFSLRRLMRAQHLMLMRESLKRGSDPIASLCRLAARAMKAGAPLNGQGVFFTQGSVNPVEQQSLAYALDFIFSVDDKNPINIAGRPATLLLLVERLSDFVADRYRDELNQGVRRLFQMRGWLVTEARGNIFDISDDQRQFTVILLDGDEPLPGEEASIMRPGFTRAPLLVVHASPRRERLLSANLGGNFHVAIEDIALVKPQSLWVWEILRRQLIGKKTATSVSAVRLVAALIVEAIREQRTYSQNETVDWHRIMELLTRPRPELSIVFQRRHAAGEIGLTVGFGELRLRDEPPIFLRLKIEDSGPAVEAH